MIKKGFLYLIILFGFPGLGQATTYYVSQNGSDSYNGTSLSTPFKTIQKAADVVNPGDKVYIRDGIYRELLTLTASGNSNQRIIFQAYADEQPIIDGSKFVESWTQYSGQIYQGSVMVNVDPVVIDDTILDHAGSIQQMHEGSFYQAGNILYVWCPEGGSPESRAVGIIKDFNDWNESYIVMITGSYINFFGFTIRYSSGGGIKSIGDFVRVENCEVKFTVYHGITMENGWGCEVEGCTVYDNVLMNWPRGGMSSGWAAGLSFVSGGNGKITGNLVFRNHGEGIGTSGGWGHAGTNGLEIKNNVSYDNWSVNIWIDHGTAVKVDGNLIYVSGNQPYPGETRSTPSGILCAEEGDYGNPGDLRNGIITNNFVIGCREGFGFGKWSANTSGLKNFVVANNTFVKNVYYGIDVDAGDHSGSLFQNNIIYQTDGYVLNFGSPNDTVFDHNCWFHEKSSQVFTWDSTVYDFDDWRSGTGRGVGSLWAEPLFVDGTGFDPAGYQIGESSHCRDNGVWIQSVMKDFWETKRPQGNGYDIGAHEYIVVPPAVGGSCFIATAAYGSPIEKHVRVLRGLRDRFLLPNAVGKSFVDLYYTYLPPAADFIANHDSLRMVVRWSLLPIVGVSWLALEFGAILTLVLILLLLALIIGTTVVLFRKIRLQGKRT